MTSRRLFLGWGLIGVCVVFMACGRSGLDAKSLRHGNTEDSGRPDVRDSGAVPDALPGKDAMLAIRVDAGLLTCGNGLVDLGEECDDGNTRSGDGCSGNCQVEAEWVCLVPGKRCTPICGDGIVHGSETCDDGNTVAGDGCSENCLVEDAGQYCGDGVTSGAEECDEGPSNGSGTYGACTSRCKFSRCGDGIVNGSEECDLGDARNKAVYGDAEGCTSTCTRPHYCGDGFVDADDGEMCDQGILGNRGGSYCTPICVVWLP